MIIAVNEYLFWKVTKLKWKFRTIKDKYQNQKRVYHIEKTITWHNCGRTNGNH